MAEWELTHLAATVPRDGRPAEGAYSAMASLVCVPFLTLTRAERGRQVHLDTFCRECDLCWDIALKHAQWATDKLHRHLKNGPPHTRNEPVRDWVVIMDWVRSPVQGAVAVRRVRDALLRRLPPDDPLLPLVLALRTQLLPSSDDARAPRRKRDFVGDPRRSVLAQRQRWSVKPDRDLLERRDFGPLRARHPRGIRLLAEILGLLDYGDPEPYRSVLTRAEARPDDAPVLRALIADLLAEPVTREWFLQNVEARHTYNEDLARRSRRHTDAGSLGWIRDDEPGTQSRTGTGGAGG